MEHFRWLLLQSYHSAAPLRVFDFYKKTYTKRCTNKSLLTREKTFSSLLELIDNVLSIPEYLLEKHYPADTDIFRSSLGRLKKVTTSYDQTRRR